MTTPPQDRPKGEPPEGLPEDGEGELPGFLSEEEPDERSTPRNDLLAGVAVAALSLFAMALSIRMPNPGALYTAPGLLPFLTGLSLLAMAFGLGVSAAREGGAKERSGSFGSGLRAFFSDDENRRLILLVGVIFLYVVLVDILTFDLRIPLGLAGLEYRFSSFELVTIAVITSILYASWRAPALKCLLVASATSVALAALFRYGFRVLLPGSG